MYRLITESLFGLHLEGNTLRFTPNPPKQWPTYKIHYRFQQTMYHITFHNPQTGAGNGTMSIDGTPITGDQFVVPLVNDGGNHEVLIELQ
jgi:cellobiose phosphorylase